MTAGLRKAVVGGLVLFGVSAPAAAAPTITTPGVIKVTDRQTQYHWIDGGTPGKGPGDTEILRVLVYNQAVRQRAIGHADLVCTFTDRRSRNCNGTYFLPKGKIMVSGVIGSRLIFEVAVVGGTGFYENARGTLTVTAAAQRPRRNLLVFRLVV
jgi:hypothetical protein